MSWSLGETKALAMKATRGCGFSWGIAEEAGFAVEWLQARGAPGVMALSQYLQTCDLIENLSPMMMDSESQLNSEHSYHPLSLGTYMLDSHHLIQCKDIQIYQPLLLIPFIAHINGQITQASWLNHTLIIDKNLMWNEDSSSSFLVEKANCTITSIEQPLIKKEAKHLTRVPSSVAKEMEILKNFAARTYVPDTQESRLSGAGAGVTDND